jgi:uncharacterized protein
MKEKKSQIQPACGDCGGRCCRYIVIEIDRPSSKNDYDNIRWHLSHENVGVFIDHDRKWHVEFRTNCRHLSEENRCMIYSERPNICRSHGNGDGECEYYDSPYSVYFSDMREFENYMRKNGIDWRYKRHYKDDGNGKRPALAVE